MPSYYEQQSDALNLPLALIVLLAAAPVQTRETTAEVEDGCYSPVTPIVDNCFGGYYEEELAQRDELEELQIIKCFADKMLSQTISLPDDAAAVLNKSFGTSFNEMDSQDDSLEEFRRFLPAYLATDVKENLFKELEQFPDNIDSRLYTTIEPDERAILQGDGLPNVFISDLPRERVKQAQVMVLSNSCDTAAREGKTNSANLLYCPIMKLEAWAKAYSASEQHLNDIRKNRISTMFYLPHNEKLGGEAVALMDRINNCSMTDLNANDLIDHRLFTLSLYGFYLFLFKISVHLTRMREGVAR